MIIKGTRQYSGQKCLISKQIQQQKGGTPSPSGEGDGG
jgi:hypothetical protein